MSQFEMNAVEKEILADIGKLDLFCWRTRDLHELTGDLANEYKEICLKYDRSSVGDPHSQVYKIKKSILIKLERDMKNLNRHQAGAWEVARGLITSVTCTCGETTRYKVPLRLIGDFCCPKERRDEIIRRRVKGGN